MNIENVIKALRGSDQYIETIFTQGGCYQFHLFLKSLYPFAIPYLTEDSEHVVTLIHDDFYDITGNVSDVQGYTLMKEKDKREAMTWSFSRTQFLSLGECAQCEEPILITNNKDR